MPLLHRIRRCLLLMAGLFVLAIVARRQITGDGWLEAVYFFVITVTTVGYGERSVVGPVEQIYTIALILFGTTLVGYTIGLVLQAMFEGQIRRAMGLQRMTREISHIADHTIICGFGRMGKTLVDELKRRNKPFVVVDSDQESIVEACDEGLLAVHGDATDEDTLLAAGIERAKTLVVALRSDADNVFLTLTARNLSRSLRIIARGELLSTEKKLLQAGADRVILPAVIGARRIAQMVTRPHAADMLELVTDNQTLDAELEELSIGPGSPLTGKSVREAGTRQRHRVMIIAIRRSDGRMVFNPEPDELFCHDDTVIVMGKQPDVVAFQEAYKL
ncbi:Voltage-gated potassium channel Kch [Pirellulimonas nuda]|uniref:Voltage-gated potassium channel Kch n=1 Tax=Pirellulimonas nuda TaxID=2528009 RepID=A0A518DGK5_9BACT|nr:potassium channel protein [Pirellulimonas nuda]QDU90611.1 Voltage-gated potassium channel Kch [Pirellulimonas nuda]